MDITQTLDKVQPGNQKWSYTAALATWAPLRHFYKAFSQRILGQELLRLGSVMHTFNPSSQEAETGKSELHTDTVSSHSPKSRDFKIAALSLSNR